MARDSDPVPLAAAALLLCALVAWVAFHRWQFLAGSPEPWGIDGYFYPVQVRSLLETGHLQYPSAPLTLWLMAALAPMVGVIVSVKVVATAATALVCVPFYGIARELGCDRGTSLFSAALAATAAASFYFAVEFVKNGVGVAMFACALWAILAARRSRRRAVIGLAVGLCIATWLTHKSAVGLLLVATAPLGARWVFGERRRLAVAGGLAAVVAGLSLLSPSRFLGAGDLRLFSELFSGEPRWTLPVLANLKEGRADYFGYEVPLALVCAVAFWLLARSREATREARQVVLGFSLFALACAIPVLEVTNPNALGFRLRLLGYVALAIIAAPLAGLALAGRSASTRAQVAVAAAAFIVAFRPNIYLAPVVEQHPALVAAIEAARGKVPEGDGIVTPERRLVFMVAWFTRRSAAQSPNAFEAARRWRLIPLPYMSPGLRRALRAEPEVISLHALDPLGTVLLSESTWDRVRVRLSDPEREYYDRWPTY